MNTDTNIKTAVTVKGESTKSPAAVATEVKESIGSLKEGIFSYLNYREFLAHWFQAKKEVQQGYSGAMFAKKAGIGSHTLLGMIIRGDRNLSAETIRAFIRALGLKGKEALYFEKLVLFNQSKNSDDRSFYFDQLSSVNGNGGASPLVTLVKNHAAYLSHWYVVAIKHLVEFSDFKADPKWIAEKLKNKITVKQAETAWNIILELGMVKAVSDGERVTYQADGRSFDIDPGLVDFAIRNFHKEYLDRTKEAIDGEDLEERELSSLTLTVSEDQLPLLKEKIKEFRKQMNLDFKNSKHEKTTLVAVNIQSLILTANVVNERADKNESNKTEKEERI